MKSQVIPLGTPAPSFTLPDLADHPHRLDDHRGRKLVLAFYRGHW